jgi:hypothetical protein
MPPRKERRFVDFLLAVSLVMFLTASVVLSTIHQNYDGLVLKVAEWGAIGATFVLLVMLLLHLFLS